MYVDACLYGTMFLHVSASLFVFPSAYMPVIYYSCAGFVGMFASITVSSFFAILCIIFLSLSESFIDGKPRLRRRLIAAKDALTTLSNLDNISKKNINPKIAISYVGFIGVVVFAPIVIQAILVSMVAESVWRRMLAVFCLQSVSNICIFLIVFILDTQVMSGLILPGIFQ